MANSVKVVLIDTQYVETDAERFKSVVQSLTGKDSSVEWIDYNGTTLARKNDNAKRKRSSSGINNHVIGSADDSTTNKSDVFCDGRNSMLSKGLSFKELDTMLMELPPLDDLHFWLSNDFMD